MRQAKLPADIRNEAYRLAVECAREREKDGDPEGASVTRDLASSIKRIDYTDADHKALLAALGSLPASVMISGYPSDLYTKLLPSPAWRSLAYQVNTRGRPRTEMLWMNYAANAAHWADHAGVDFIDRQRIKRKAARWQRYYRDLLAGERMAVLAAILELRRSIMTYSGDRSQ